MTWLRHITTIPQFELLHNSNCFAVCRRHNSIGVTPLAVSAYPVSSLKKRPGKSSGLFLREAKSSILRPALSTSRDKQTYFVWAFAYLVLVFL